MKIIGLAGLARVGKTTIAEYLRDNHGYTILSFATPLKEALVALTDLPMEYFTDQDLKHEPLSTFSGKSPREVMQLFGTDFCRNMIAEDFWCNLMHNKILNTQSNVVIDDIRFQDEADLITSLGGVVVNLHRKSVERDSDHVSENGVHATMDIAMGDGVFNAYNFFIDTMDDNGVTV